MKKLIWVGLFLIVTNVSADAFLYEIKMSSQAEIVAMSDEQLKNAYMEAKIEEIASAEFHQAAGFSNAKEYDKRKDLLRYIIHLRQEMQKREIEPDPIDSWLK